MGYIAECASCTSTKMWRSAMTASPSLKVLLCRDRDDSSISTGYVLKRNAGVSGLFRPLHLPRCPLPTVFFSRILLLCSGHVRHNENPGGAQGSTICSFICISLCFELRDHEGYASRIGRGGREPWCRQGTPLTE